MSDFVEIRANQEAESPEPAADTVESPVCCQEPRDRGAIGPIAPAKPELLQFELSKLVQHPLQNEFNPPTSAVEEAQLDADLETGQREPIHVMPPENRAGLAPYCILDGHRRAASLRRLGQTHGNVLIRHDLQEADAAAVEAEFLRFNANRRQLDPLAITKNLKRQAELASDGWLSHYDLQKLATQISRIFGGMSVRNAQRYIHAADAAPEIQAAHRRGDIPLSLAAQVGALTPDLQQDIVAAIQGITDCAKIREIVATRVREHGAPAARRPIQYTPLAIGLIDDFEARIGELVGHFDQLHGPTLAKHLPALCTMRTTVAKLIAAAKRGIR